MVLYLALPCFTASVGPLRLGDAALNLELFETLWSLPAMFFAAEGKKFT
jgi:hypothetical protein